MDGIVGDPAESDLVCSARSLIFIVLPRWEKRVVVHDFCALLNYDTLCAPRS
jgi:hypothetical protein